MLLSSSGPGGYVATLRCKSLRLLKAMLAETEGRLPVLCCGICAAHHKPTYQMEQQHIQLSQLLGQCIRVL